MARIYRNRWIKTAKVAELRHLEPTPTSIHQPGFQGSGNVNVIAHAGAILALPELGLPWEISSTVDTLGQHDFNGSLRSNMTAHPKKDARTGELFFFGYDFGPVYLRYHVADSGGALIRSIDIKKPLPTMMHDFGVTQSTAIFMDFPVVFDLDMNAHLPFRWRDDVPS